MKSRTLPFVFAIFLANQALSDQQLSSFFSGAQLGFARHTVDVSGAGANYEEESGNSFSPDLSFGYKIDDNWSVVAQYTQYGEADLFKATLPIDVNGDIIAVDTTFSSDTTGLSISGQFMTTRSVKHWSVGAKLGLMKWDTDFNISAKNYGSYTESDSGVAIYGGFLGAYAISDKLDFTLGVDWFVNDLDIELIEGASTDMQYSRLSTGINYYW